MVYFWHNINLGHVPVVSLIQFWKVRFKGPDQEIMALDLMDGDSLYLAGWNSSITSAPNAHAFD